MQITALVLHTKVYATCSALGIFLSSQWWCVPSLLMYSLLRNMYRTLHYELVNQNRN